MSKENPYEEGAFRRMPPDAQNWHIMAEIRGIKMTSEIHNGRIGKLERRKKFDTGVSSIFGLIGGIIASFLRRPFG